MRSQFILAASVLSLAVFNGCGTTDPVLATVGTEQITRGQFEDHYLKNNASKDSAAVPSPEERRRYLDLLIKFQLKVQEAHARGLDRDSAVRAELDTYRSTVSQTYVMDKELLTPGVRSVYDRRSEILRASHILVRCAPNAEPADTLKAYRQALSLVAQLALVSFDTLAMRASEDKGSAVNGGDVGYFSGGRMVPEFEDACFALHAGEYSRIPIRTQFGYHIIKLIVRRPNPGSAHVAHILVRFNETKGDSTAVRDSVRSIYRQLKNGLPFEAAVRQHSADPNSIPRGGDIGFYDADKMPPALAEGISRIGKDSLIEPFQMPYGYHIVKLLGFRPLPSFTESETEIRNAYQQQRYPSDYSRFLAHLRRQHGVVEDTAVLRTLSTSFDQRKTASDPDWMDTVSLPLRKSVLVTIGSHPYTVLEILVRIGNTTDLHSSPLNASTVRDMVQKVEETLLLEEHGRSTMDQNPNFVALMKEYEDGVLLYRIEQDEVWQKLPVNDSLQRAYFAGHREDYRWPDRVNFAEIFVPTDSLAKFCAKKIRSGADFKAIAAKYSTRPGYAEKKGEWGLLPTTVNDLAQRAARLGRDSVSAPFAYQGGWSIVKNLDVDGARLKTYEEALPEVSSAYQDVAAKKREQEWVDLLRARYSVHVNDEVLRSAFAGTAHAR